MTIEIVNHADTPVSIENVSKDRYVDPSVIDQEWTGIWRNSWLAAGLVITERGAAASFRCAHPAWTYDLDGELSAIPYKERFAEGVPCADRALKIVHTKGRKN